MASVLDLEMRRRIVALVRQYPGLHVRDVARRLETSVALVEYHVPFLVRHGLVTEMAQEGFRRLFPVVEAGAARLGERDQRLLGLLRQPVPLHIVLLLLEREGLRHRELTQELRLGKSTVSFHLRKLEALGIVRPGPDGGYRVGDAARVTRILLDHEPVPDLLDRFLALWDAFYRRSR